MDCFDMLFCLKDRKEIELEKKTEEGVDHILQVNKIQGAL